MRILKSTTLRVGVIALLTSTPALAYIDPGSGMVFWQGIIAVIGVILVFVREPRRSIKRLIDRFKRK